MGANPGLQFTNDSTQYAAARRVGLCDAQGYFKFEKLSPGEFFVVSQIFWEVSNMQQGGVLMQAVQVRADETQELVLAP